MKDKLLSVNDICEYLGIGRDTVYKWIKAQNLPAYRIGRFWKFRKTEVDKWLEKCSC